jgi:hypothetical protein
MSRSIAKWRNSHAPNVHLMAISCHLAQTNRERVRNDTIKCHSAQLPKRGRAKFRRILELRHAVVAPEIGEDLLILLAQFITHAPSSRADTLIRQTA